MQDERCFEILTPDGHVVLTVRVVNGSVATEAKEPDVTKRSTTPATERGTQRSEGESMTNAQKRYLFRLMAVRGFEGDKAHEELKRRLRVRSLSDVTKLDASRLIEHLVDEGGGGNGNGSPV